MPNTVISSREFNQDRGKAKQAASAGPVIITDRGRPAHVLLTYSAYKKLARKPARIADMLALPGVEQIKLPLTRARAPAQAADLT